MKVSVWQAHPHGKPFLRQRASFAETGAAMTWATLHSPDSLVFLLVSRVGGCDLSAYKGDQIEMHTSFLGEEARGRALEALGVLADGDMIRFPAPHGQYIASWQQVTYFERGRKKTLDEAALRA